MPELSVAPLDPPSYRVRVSEGASTTEHEVEVPPGFLAREGLAGVDREEVVRWTFGFLLEREPATSILGRFSLDLVPRYFPEYLEHLRARFGT
jgi:hypothetical protein